MEMKANPTDNVSYNLKDKEMKSGK